MSETDKYDRLLRYVWIVGQKDGKAYLLNEIMVDEGYAAAVSYPPDVKYQARFLVDQQEAQAAGRGLWSACPGGQFVASETQPAGDTAPAPLVVTQAPAPVAAPQGNCDPSYPTVCIPPPPPDLDCKDVP